MDAENTRLVSTHHRSSRQICDGWTTNVFIILPTISSADFGLQSIRPTPQQKSQVYIKLADATSIIYRDAARIFHIRNRVETHLKGRTLSQLNSSIHYRHTSTWYEYTLEYLALLNYISEPQEIPGKEDST